VSKGGGIMVRGKEICKFIKEVGGGITKFFNEEDQWLSG